MQASILLLLLGLTAVSAETFFAETFESDAKWESADGKGVFTNEAGAVHGDADAAKGLKTSQDAKFYATSARFPEFLNTNKDLVVSLTVQHGQGIDCGGGYVKVMPTTEAKAFNGDSEYFMMFGPDICGQDKKIHLIFGYNGKNLLWKKKPSAKSDKATHLYTVVVHPDNTYEVSVDGEKVESGSLEEDWDFLEPKEIDDPEDTKPADWVDEQRIADPEAKKPEDWDSIPEMIQDPESEKPDDWDEDDDGEWEPSMIPNPEFKGEWRPEMIENPAYKGPFVPKRIANPEYKEDAELYLARKPIGAIGIDIWQVKSGSVFDNIIIADSVEEVKAFNDKNFFAHQEAEKKMIAAEQAEEQKKFEEEQAAMGSGEAEEDFEEDDY